MGVFSELDMDRRRLEAVSIAMEDFVEAETAEVQMERRIDSLVRDLDELCAFAANPETVDLVQAQRAGVGQIIMRAQLIGSFLMAHSPKPGLRIVTNG